MMVLTFQLGTEAHAMDIRHVHEVVPLVHLRQATGGPEWLAGLFVYHGTVIPVVDMHRLAGSGECPTHLSSRIILSPVRSTNGGERLLGFLATQVADIRSISAEDQSLSNLAPEGKANFGAIIADGANTLRLIDPARLLPESALRQLTSFPTEPVA